MIPFDSAVEIVRRSARRARVESVSLERALGRALVEPALAPQDSPPFDKSAMDGYALSSADRAASYHVVETIPAGSQAGGPAGSSAGGGRARALGPGECARIMTGAMLPPGADRVLRLEYAREEAGLMHPLRAEEQSNVILRGENLRAGEIVLTPRRLAPQDVGILASLGLPSVKVTARPVVGVIATGPELRDVGEELRAGEIYDSNGPQLRAQLESAGCEPRRYARAEDTIDSILSLLKKAIPECDGLILSGGVSMGDFDHVPAALERAGYSLHFRKVAVRPGMPTVFGTRPSGWVFGLPGNPVSTFVIFELVVKVLLDGIMGIPEEGALLRGILAAPVKRRVTDRVEFRPVRLEGGLVHPIPYHGSSHLNVLGGANGLMRVEVGVSAIDQGTEVHVRPIR